MGDMADYYLDQMFDDYGEEEMYGWGGNYQKFYSSTSSKGDSNKYGFIDDVTIHRVSEKALLLSTACNELKQWLPRSQITFGERLDIGWYPALEIADWLINKKEL